MSSWAGRSLCLIVLVVLPLLSLILGSVRREQGLGLASFAEVLSGRLYIDALKNSLILGAWTGLFSLVIGVSLAWAVSRTDMPGKPLIQITARCRIFRRRSSPRSPSSICSARTPV